MFQWDPFPEKFSECLLKILEILPELTHVRSLILSPSSHTGRDSWLPVTIKVGDGGQFEDYSKGYINSKLYGNYFQKAI